jgi:C-terminal processing protease CtpA/Prc
MCRFFTAACFCCLLTLASLAQTALYTPAQIERVAKLSELYGHIKFFHPYLGYKPINWDSAFAATAPLVAAATTDAETVAALRQLLGVLNDAATVAHAKTQSATATSPTGTAMQVFFDADSTLVLQTNNYAHVNDKEFERVYSTLESFVEKLPKARAARLDLRSQRPIPAEFAGYFGQLLDEIELARQLAAAPLVTPGTRRRQHSGFAPEQGSTSGGYASGFLLQSGETVRPSKQPFAKPVTIETNRHSELTPQLMALCSQPHVTFRADDPPSEAGLVPTVAFPFSESITVSFRTGELINADGTVGLAADPKSGGAPVAPAVATYPANKYPTLGYRLLAGAKIWSVIHYFFAYKDLMPTDWNKALRAAVAELAAASDSTQYALAVARFYRHLQDGHGFISATPLRYYAGSGGVFVDVRFIEDRPIITRIYSDSLRTKGLVVGDIITSVNGEPIAARIARLEAIQPASNEWTRRAYISGRLLRSPVGTPVRIGLLGADGEPKTVTVNSLPTSQLQTPKDTTKPFRLLPGNIGYAHMGQLQTTDVPRMFAAFGNTKAIIFDMRNYPNGTAWAIAPYLSNRQKVIGAKFCRYAPNQPDLVGASDAKTMQKFFFDQPIPGNTGQGVYRGKTVMLIDERTQSQAEHSGLFFEAANGTEFIGSPTAGANGDVTRFGIPGGISLSFSGHDVRHADGRQLQQVGLQPHIQVRPTIRGIRAGKDEVLDRAITYLTTGK